MLSKNDAGTFKCVIFIIETLKKCTKAYFLLLSIKCNYVYTFTSKLNTVYLILHFSRIVITFFIRRKLETSILVYIFYSAVCVIFLSLFKLNLLSY